MARFGVETTIIVPGSFTTGTNHFANAGHPADTAIAEEYGVHYAGLMDQVAAKLAELSPPDADPTDVARAIVSVVDTRKGRRPFRVHIDPADDGAEVVNMIATGSEPSSTSESNFATSSTQASPRHTDRTSAVTDTLPKPVESLLRAANANDTNAFPATFTDNGVVDDWGREFAGQAAIREWSDREFIGQRVRLDITQITYVGGTTVVTADVGGDGFNGPSHFSFQLDGDQISRMTIRA